MTTAAKTSVSPYSNRAAPAAQGCHALTTSAANGAVQIFLG
jgi:hypothetical protein